MEEMSRSPARKATSRSGKSTVAGRDGGRVAKVTDQGWSPAEITRNKVAGTAGIWCSVLCIELVC